MVINMTSIQQDGPCRRNEAEETRLNKHKVITIQALETYENRRGNHQGSFLTKFVFRFLNTIKKSLSHGKYQ